MKLVFTSYVSTPGYDQPEKWLKHIEAYTGILESLTHDHTVTGIERINYEGVYEQKGVHYYFIRLKKKVVRFPFRMHRYIKRLQPDVVFINGFIFPLQIIQLRLTLDKAVKIIVLHRAEKPFKGVKRYLQKTADKCVDAYLFTSSEFANEWKRNINVKKIHEVIQASSIFRPADRTEARQQTNINGQPVFLWVGSLIPRKDPLTVLKAFIRYLDHQSSATLYMIYQSNELLEELRDLAKGKEAIQLIGKVEHGELQNWYNHADFIISGSHHEGSGVAVCEAMSCGCIPVITDIVSFRRMTGPGKCGLLYEPGNEKALLAALLKTTELDIKKERDKTLQQFKEELSFEAIARKIEQVIALLDKK